MKVILTEDVTALGAIGSTVEVARGYARNFLIPQGKAVEATPGNMTRVQHAKAKYIQMKAKEKEAALAQVSRLVGVKVTIAQRAGEEERLYGSVTRAMIAEALAAQGLEVDRKQLELPEPIKKLGNYEIIVRLAPEVKGPIIVEVVAETA